MHPPAHRGWWIVRWNVRWIKCIVRSMAALFTGPLSSEDTRLRAAHTPFHHNFFHHIKYWSASSSSEIMFQIVFYFQRSSFHFAKNLIWGTTGPVLFWRITRVLRRLAIFWPPIRLMMSASCEESSFCECGEHLSLSLKRAGLADRSLGSSHPRWSPANGDQQ